MTWAAISNSVIGPAGWSFDLGNAASTFFSSDHSFPLSNAINLCSGGSQNGAGSMGLYTSITNTTGNKFGFFPPVQTSRRASMGCWMYHTVPESGLFNEDWIMLVGPDGVFVNAKSLNNGSANIIELESSGNASAYGNVATVTNSTKYWLAMLWNTITTPNATYGSNFQIRIYNADLTLLNTITPTGANPNANVAFNYVLFGANNVDYAQDYRFYIDSMRLDYNESPEWPIMPTGAVASASTYYVATTGSDATGIGSIGNPWQTIGKGISSLSVAGDKLLIRGGVYAENGPNIYGPSGVGISNETTIAAYPGESPVLKGPGNSGSLLVESVNNLIIDGLTISNLNQCIYVRGSCTNVTIKNCNVCYSGQELIRVMSNCHDILITSNLIHDSGILAGGGQNGEGCYIGTSSGDLQDNTYRVTVRSNVIYNTISEGIEFKEGTHDCVAEYNTLHDCSTVDSFRTIEVDDTQNWASDPVHIIRGNTIYSSKSPIRLGTGTLCYNNVIYSIDDSYYAILVDNAQSDSYVRKIYHNTIVTPSAKALNLSAGTVDVLNNIGPTGDYNLASVNGFYVSTNSGNFRLVAGAAPVNAGTNLLSVVPTDFDGAERVGTEDIGAFESTNSVSISTIGTLRAVTLRQF